MSKTTITEDQLKEMFNKMLNETTPVMIVAYCEFYPSEVLEEIDPLAYRIALADYYYSIKDEYIVEGMYIWN